MAERELYFGVKLLFPDPEASFPRDFNPELPFRRRTAKVISLLSFVDVVEGEGGTCVIPLEDFDQNTPTRELQVLAAGDVELSDGATFIVVPRFRFIVDPDYDALDQWGCGFNNEMPGEANGSLQGCPPSPLHCLIGASLLCPCVVSFQSLSCQLWCQRFPGWEPPPAPRCF